MVVGSAASGKVRGDLHDEQGGGGSVLWGRLHKQEEAPALELAVEEVGHNLEVGEPLSHPWVQSSLEVLLLLSLLGFLADLVDPLDLVVQGFHPSLQGQEDQVGRFLHPFQGFQVVQ